MTKETAEKNAIKQYLKLKNAFVFHNLAGLGCYPGLADLTCIHFGRVYQIEVKAGKNKQSVNQKQFQEDWEDKGGFYICGGLNEVMKIIK